MADYIDREELLKLTENITFTLSDNATSLKAMAEEAVQRVIQHFHHIVLNAPSVDAVEQKHGHWIEELASQHGNAYDGRTWTKYKKYRCSYCGITNGNRRPDYCPHCGAKMDEVAE